MANTVNIGDYQYTLYDNTGKASAIVRDKTKSSYGNIPSTITVSGKTYNVTNLNRCFYDCSSLTTAPTIPNSVTDIYNCFYGCSSLTTAPTIPSGVTMLNNCFYGCSSLTTAPTIPSGVTKMSGCFQNCSSLTTAPTIPNSVTNLSYCFYGCSSLTTAPTIPNSVTNLSYCFYNCSALMTAPTIPSSVTDIYSCFYGCSSLTTAPTIPSSVTDMRNCFLGCSSLTTAPTIPSSVTMLNRCFEDCSSLTTAPTIPSSVTNLNSCFYGCSSLTTAPTIPSSVTIMTGCFSGCRALTGNIIINANTTEFDSLFVNTQKGIWLTGTSSKLSDYAATGNNNNVYVGEIPLSYRLTAERVAYDGQTEPVPEGLWAHVKLTIDWSNFTENSIDNITLKNGIVSINPTWYSDADKTNAITLPNWRPNSASTTIHCWINVTSATHVLSATVADRYHTGVVITFTVPQQFRTVEFLAGGHGVAFGMPATKTGMEIAMPVTIEDKSLTVTNNTLYQKNTTVDLKEANNNVSANTYMAIVCRDKNNKEQGRFGFGALTNGQTRTEMYVRNYDANGNLVANKGFSINMDKSGNITYGVSQPEQLRAALSLQEFIDLNAILRNGIASSLSMANWKTVNCSGSITTSLSTAYSGYCIKLSGRIAITNFSRTGANAGASCQLGVKPKHTFTQNIGFRAESPREYVFVTVDTNGLATFRTSETYTNASGSTLTFIIPNWIVNFNN